MANPQEESANNHPTEAMKDTSKPPTFSTFTKIIVGLVGGLILLIVFAAIAHNLQNHGSALAPSDGPSKVQQELDKISTQVAQDAEKQYEIARRSGTATDAYVNAGLVAAAYLQAKDEANFQKWKRIEATEAKRAGISVQ